MAIAAESMDLGICYIGGIRNDLDTVAKRLSLPELTVPLFGLTIGVPETLNGVKPRMPFENILSEKGILYRMNRSIQVEGAFGVLKNDYEFQRFLLRGKTKVKLEILLLCMGYNLNKLHAKIQNERTGSHLFPVKETA